jgi:hypothetical protein
MQEVEDEVKDQEDGHESDNETSPRPQLHIGHGSSVECVGR